MSIVRGCSTCVFISQFHHLDVHLDVHILDWEVIFKRSQSYEFAENEALSEL
jgi:hypothetical protein